MLHDLPEDTPLLLLRAGEGAVSLVLLLLCCCCWCLGNIDSKASAMASAVGGSVVRAPRLPRDPLGEWLGVGWVTWMLMGPAAGSAPTPLEETWPPSKGLRRARFFCIMRKDEPAAAGAPAQGSCCIDIDRCCHLLWPGRFLRPSAVAVSTLPVKNSNND